MKMKTMKKSKIERRRNKIDYKKLRNDLLKAVATPEITSQFVTVESTYEKELLRLAKKYNLKISDYIND